MDYKKTENKEQLKEKIRLLMSDYTNMLVDLADSDTHKSAILYYWLKDYKIMINREDSFNPKYLKEYSRGDIISVNLGFKPGSEQGGLHYGIVIEDNPKTSDTVTIIPLRSLKPKDNNGKEVHWSELFLGNELYEKAERKLRDGIASCNKKLNILHLEDERVSKQFKSISDVLSLIDSKNYVKEVVNPLKDNMLFLKEETDKIINSIAEIEQQIKMMQTWRDKFSKMKNGSVALIKQITTISKIRIINPIKDTDALSGLRISVKYLNSIDNKLKEFYIYK